MSDVESPKRIAVPYVRFSSGAQAKGDSERRQDELIGRWLLANSGYTRSELKFKDLGVSGWDGEHLEHGFGQLLAAIRQGHIPAGSVVLVEAIDRIGRLEPMEMLPLISSIVKAGVSIITLDDGAVYDLEAANKHLLFMLVAKIQAAWQYSDTLSRRLSASWEGKRQKARNGEQVKRYTPMWLTTDNQLDPEIAPFARQAFEDFADGLGGRRIIKRLRELSGAFDKITPAGLMLWMENRTAIGYWNDIPDQHPALISIELWHRVQQERQRRIKESKSAPSKHFLTGLVKCGVCGSNFKNHAAKNGVVSLRCVKRERLGEIGCSNGKSLPGDVVEWVRRKTYRAWLERVRNQRRLSDARVRIIEIDRELEVVGQEITQTIKLAKGLDDVQEIQNEIRRLQARRDGLKAEKIGLEQDDTERVWTMTIRELQELQKSGDSDAVALEADKMKLNALLQTAGYAITVKPVREGLELSVGKTSFVYLRAVRTKPVGVYVTTYQVVTMERLGLTTYHLRNENGLLVETARIQTKLDKEVTMKEVASRKI
ncbi:recombinase family protein [Aquipseudomonas alcaligenes]|uniref:Recombinase family protein n=1 Tax=Aquipseudomonas alcaligenes TaxID=43263 RepID=A0AB73HTC6_AQUAC|nr:recombinase family protein [Pseudomonas alcaligenes]MDH0141145.1 recombinase family protein [Pseudomonas alcaligenes]